MASYFRGSTEKNAVGYKCGENIRFKLELVHDGNKFACPLFKWELYGDDGKASKGMVSGDSGEFTIDTSLCSPGFVHLIVTACALDGTPLKNIDKFEGGAGAELDKISEGMPEPADYDEFWARQLERLEKVQPEVISKTEVDSGNPDFVSYNIQLRCVGDMPTSGVLTLPRGAKAGTLSARIGFHGYGFASSAPNCVPGKIFFQMNIHGYDNLREPAYYDAFSKAHAGFGFNREENKTPETCYFLYVILRDLQGLRYLRTLPEYDGKGFYIEGGSMGAMQATSVAAHIPDAIKLDIAIPWLCDLGGITKGRLRGWRPDIDDGVMYFDTALAAKRVKCPVEIRCGLGDYVCPPSTETVLWHNFKIEKKITFVQNMTHPYRPVETISYTL